MMNEPIQDYRIVSLIREEPMGKVYLGVNLASNTKAIIRLINPRLADDVFYKNLSGNSHVLVSLNHPSIGKFYKYVKKEDQVYLISEYVPNATTLRQYLASFEGRTFEEKLWDVFMQLADAFHYAHSKGVSHFAIHPGNILISAGEVKVLDFGIAALFLDQPDSELSEKFGTEQMHYRSPEHVLHKPLDMRSDLYAIGVLLFELLTGQTPYPSTLSVPEIDNKIVSHSLPPIKIYTKVFAYSYSMQAIVDKATAKNPSYRFQNFKELKDSLLEERAERETILINKLMQELKTGKQLNSSEKKFVSRHVRPKARKKRIEQALLVVGLMAGTVAIGVNFKHLASDKTDLSLRKKPDHTDAISTKEPDKNNTVTKPDEATQHIPAPGFEQQITPDTQEATASHKGSAAGLPAETERDTKETSTAHAGFALETSPVNKFSQRQLQQRVESFYEALRAKELSEASEYYAPTLTRFFNERHVNKKQVQNLLLKAWKRTPEDKHEILWDTFRHSQDREGNITMEFYMNYVYRRTHRNTWRERKIYTMIKMDRNLKIYYMSGD
jgi:serine/threonine protein kinase